MVDWRARAPAQSQGTGVRYAIGPEDAARMAKGPGDDDPKKYQGMADLLKTHPRDGIARDDDLATRKIHFGSNTYHQIRTAKWFTTCLWEVLHGFTQIVLLMAFLGFVVMGILEEKKKLGCHGVFDVIIAVCIIFLFTAISVCTQARHFQQVIKQLERIDMPAVKVIRAGIQLEISRFDLLVGDIVVLDIDDEIPADGLLDPRYSLSIDTSRITGKRNIIIRNSGKSYLRSGGKVIDGSGTMMVTAVGKFSESEILRMETFSKGTDKSGPLQMVLKDVATFMRGVGLIVAVAVAAYIVVFRDYFVDDSAKHHYSGDTLEQVIEISRIAGVVFVVAIPQGLPLAFTSSLLSSVKKMKANNILVLTPAACEALAYCNELLCDMIGITPNQDDCQPMIKDVVKECQQAGIKVRIVTHYSPATAIATAREFGIWDSNASEEENLIQGERFRKLSPSQREKIAEKILVMVESSPLDKLLFVEALRSGQKVVAFVGYATHDTHALHQANIGLAMGNHLTEDTKESSDIIILDGKFETVVKAFKWGRYMHENVLKVMHQQLIANVVAVTINCLAAIYYLNVPLNAVQFVWINLIIFCLGPLASVTEAPADQLMKRPAAKLGQPLTTYIQWIWMSLQALYQIAVIILVNFEGGELLKSYTADHASKVKNTMILNTFVVSLISIEWIARITGILDNFPKWIRSNYVFVGILVIILAVQFVIVEYLGKVFLIVRLNSEEWQLSLTQGIMRLLFAVFNLLKKNHH